MEVDDRPWWGGDRCMHGDGWVGDGDSVTKTLTEMSGTHFCCSVDSFQNTFTLGERFARLFTVF